MSLTDREKCAAAEEESKIQFEKGSTVLAASLLLFSDKGRLGVIFLITKQRLFCNSVQKAPTSFVQKVQNV